MFPLIEKALRNLGVANYAIYGEPSNEAEFYQMVKPVIGTDETGTNLFAESPSDYSITYQQFSAELLSVKLQQENTEYQRSRSKSYPPIGDQLDALFHAGVFPPEMAAKIQAIKDQYPKPE